MVVFQPRPAPVAAHGVFFNTVLTLVALPNQSQAWVTNQQKSQMSPGFEILGTIPLPNAKAQIEVTLADSTPHVLVLGELLGLFIPQLQPFTPGFDPENGLTSELTAPEITQPVFYIYDHLGNTRATYHVDITCPSTKVYVLEYASEYYPYGKTLRDYTLGGVKEKYETTQHERDQETGLDYRGERFCDSDVVRFLSVDPLADHPNQIGMSPNSAFWNNPIKYNDPDGRCPICPFIAKGLTGAGIDYMLQGTMNYASGMGLSDAFSPGNIDMSDVALSGAQGMLPWSVPGGKYGKAAGVAFSDVMVNYGKSLVNDTDYSMEQMWQDFIIGFAAQLGSEKVAEFFGEGIVYLRKDATGNLKPYVGQAKSEQRFKERHKEHARANPDSDFEFGIIERESDKGKFPTDLDKKEQKHLDNMRGPTNKSNPDGGTSNKKNVIKKN